MSRNNDCPCPDRGDKDDSKSDKSEPADPASVLLALVTGGASLVVESAFSDKKK
jgi:hypothetical protein